MIIPVLSGVLTANGAPVDGNSGAALPGVDRQRQDRGMLLLDATNTGSTVGSLTGKWWVYSYQTSLWYPGSIDATAANKGLINGGNALGETGTDIIRHMEEVYALLYFSRVFFEIVAAANLTALTVKLDCLRYEGDL